MYSLMKIWKPEIYQGHKRKKRYFEGWYYKLVDENEDNKIAIIPGISKEDNGKSHAFIQIIDSDGCTVDYYKYDRKKFKYSRNKFEVIIGDNYFSSNRVVLNAKNDKKAVEGSLEFQGITPWPVTIGSPGIMGWFAYMPFMECYHGVLSLNHKIKGTMVNNNREIDFSGGKGYIEKDWGRSFPKEWIWAQSNHFGEEGVSLTASIAKIPWIGKTFTGFIIGLLYKKQLYKFATYTGAKLSKFEVNGNKFDVIVTGKEFQLEISGEKEEGGELYSPNLGTMSGTVNESLTSKVKVKLLAINGDNNKIIFEGTGKNAGMEIQR